MSAQGNYPPPPPPPTPPYAPAPYYDASMPYPGRGLGIAAMVLSIINIIGIPTSFIGVVLGHVAYSQSKRAGVKNTYALMGIIVGWAFVGIVFILFSIMMIYAAASFF